jgi:hypothetical protein
MSRLIFYPGNDQIHTLPDVKDADGVAVTGATITATLYTSTGELVDTAVFDEVAMTDVDGIAGSYECEIPADFTADDGSLYYVLFDCTSPGKFSIRQKATVRTRWV